MLKNRVFVDSSILIAALLSSRGGSFYILTQLKDEFQFQINDYTLEEIAKYKIKNLLLTRDLHNSPLYPEHHGILTRYEKRAQKQGLKINYLRFEFDD